MLNIDNITRLRINEGTIEKPFVLNEREVQTLVSLASSGNKAIDVRGVVNTETEMISGYANYIIQKAFPHLTILAEVVKDTNWGVTLSQSAVNEGKNVTINCRNIEASSLACMIGDVSLNVTSGTYTVAALKQSLKVDMEHRTLTAPMDKGNTSWVAQIELKFYPKYIENPQENDFVNVNLTVNAVAVTGMQVTVAEVVEVGGSMELGITTLPLNNTKAGSMTYAFTANEGMVSQSGGKYIYYAPQNEAMDNIAATALVNNVTAADANAEVIVSNPFIQLVVESDNEDFNYDAVEATIMRNGVSTTLKNGQKMYVAGNGAETYAVSLPPIYAHKLSAPTSITPLGVKTIVRAFYEEIVPDVYVVYTDGTKEAYGTIEANNFKLKGGSIGLADIDEKVAGVGVISIDATFMIANREETTTKQWSTNTNEQINVGGYPQTTTNTDIVRNYFAGIKNTDAILDHYSSPVAQAAGNSAPAATYCRELTVTVGGMEHEGYLPSIGEMLVFCDNITKVNNLLSKSLVKNTVNMKSGFWWSSCQCSAGSAWCLGNGSPNDNSKANGYRVRPFYAF